MSAANTHRPAVSGRRHKEAIPHDLLLPRYVKRTMLPPGTHKEWRSAMSIFGSILSKIMHHGEAAAAPAPSAPSASPTSPPSAAPTPTSTMQTGTAPGATAGSSQDNSSPGAVASASPSPAGSVDVAAVLDGLAAKNSQKLDWKHSIVDMMKLLDLDSSLTARKELAGELQYTGDTNDSAGMNLWLHKQVMQKLADNGGKVPDALRV